MLGGRGFDSRRLHFFIRLNSPRPMTSLSSQLNEHWRQMASFDMRIAFAAEPNRASQFSLTACGLLLDYSKNLISEETIRLLLQLAKEQKLIERLSSQFDGARVNQSEDRPALHTALRAQQERSPVANKIMEQARANRKRIYDLRQNLVEGALTGFGNQPIDTLVNIGIGGSHLGPLTLCSSLPAAPDAPECSFLSSLSPDALTSIRQRHNLATTIFIISSKSFTTQETLMNANQLLAEYERQVPRARAVKHFYAVTAEPARAKDFGIPDDQIFSFDKSVGGRFSLWSSIALPIIMHIGREAFERLLKGAYDMDEHSLTSKPSMPLLLALLAYWYANYWRTQTHCINAYEHSLRRLPEYLQQLFMESNGKKDGANEILWGGVGTEIQHSYMQLCHQGKHLIPMDIICGARPPQAKTRSPTEQEAHRILIANALAQAQALLQGRDEDEAQAELRKKNSSGTRATDLMMPGNRPSNFLLYDELNPYSLGALLSLYEHRTALLGYLTQSNPFDQWGVELGKKLSQRIHAEMAASQTSQTNQTNQTSQTSQFDSSTNRLIEWIRQKS